MNATAAVSDDFQRELWSGLCSGAQPKLLCAVTTSDRHPNQLRNETKQINPFADWLLRFASSQRNVDRVMTRPGGTVSVLCVVSAVAFVIYMLLR